MKIMFVKLLTPEISGEFWEEGAEEFNNTYPIGSIFEVTKIETPHTKYELSCLDPRPGSKTPFRLIQDELDKCFKVLTDQPTTKEQQSNE